MGNWLVPKGVVRWLRAGTSSGKVDRLENLTRSLTSNTKLVADKYLELKKVEQEVDDVLGMLKKEDYAKEGLEIDSLQRIPEDERDKFKKALVTIKDKGISELEPIAETSQRIKAHMLITLNKALIQKAILVAKSKLASNAHLQLETLKIIAKETKNINKELTDLLKELDSLNQDAIDKFSSFKKEVGNTLNNDGTNVVESIVEKISNVGKNIE